ATAHSHAPSRKGGAESVFVVPIQKNASSVGSSLSLKHAYVNKKAAIALAPPATEWAAFYDVLS
ncbi:MAG: hypothetical protein KKA67_12205, partial [Spirochaetes bacterium]|nr:hypothetical protein [Spirochaetota bacterium]